MKKILTLLSAMLLGAACLNAQNEVDHFTGKSGKIIDIYCIKHGTLSINAGGKWIHIDPVSDKIPPVTDYSAMEKADLILVTHDHGDHLDNKAIDQLFKASTVIVSNPGSQKQIAHDVLTMSNGDSKTIGDITIEAVPAYNNSAEKQNFHPKGRDNGYIINYDGVRIYIGGDTEDIDEMKDIKNIDIAFLPCNLPYTMTPEQLERAAKTVNPRILFPYHYGQTDMQKVQNLLAGSGIEVRIRQYQ